MNCPLCNTELIREGNLYHCPKCSYKRVSSTDFFESVDHQSDLEISTDVLESCDL